ncbi:hypothetical protein GW17_00058269 [Ensete ventricosum]|nr:hypothetical protein GW17_00058269 [Ensete ventricosum]
MGVTHDWRSFTAEIHRVDTPREEDAPVARPQGAAPRPGLPPTRATAARSEIQPARCRPKAAALAAWAATHADGVQRRHLCRAAIMATVLYFSHLLLGLRACDYLKLHREAQREREGYNGNHDAVVRDHDAW